MLNNPWVIVSLVLILIIEGIFARKWDKLKGFKGTYEDLPKEEKEKINDTLLVISVCKTAYWEILLPCFSSCTLGIIPRTLVTLLFYKLVIDAEKKYFLYKTINKKIYNLMRILCVAIVIALCSL